MTLENSPERTLTTFQDVTFKFAGNPSGRMVFFYSNGPGGALSFSVNTDRTVFVTTLGIADVSSQAAIPDDDAWHHIAVIHENGKEIRFYVDGVLGDTVAYSSGVNFTRTQTLFSLGAEWNGALQYIGSVDRLKVSSGMLTPDQLDLAVKASLAPRMMILGVVQRYDYTGLDISAKNLENPEFFDPPIDNRPKSLFDLVEKGHLGVKTGKGFFDYSGKKPEGVLKKRDMDLLRVIKNTKFCLEEKVE